MGEPAAGLPPQWPAPVRAVVWLLLLAAPLAVLLSAPTFTGQVLFPGDLLFFYPPWDQVRPAEMSAPSNWILFDEIFEFYPWHLYAREVLGQGILPLWCPGNFCGSPFVGIYQSAVFYPVNWLLWLLPLWRLPVVSAWIHGLLAGCGMVLWLRRHKAGFPGQLTGAWIYQLCGYLVLWMGHPHSKTAAWVPLLFWLAEELADGRRRLLPPFAAVLGIFLLSGHAETAAHALLGLAVYLLVRWVAGLVLGKKPRISWLLLAAGLSVGIALAAIQAFPLVGYLGRSSAFAARAEGVWTTPIFYLEQWITFLAPDFFGNSAHGNYWFKEFNYSEINGGYLGLAGLLLAVVGAISRRRRPEGVALIVLALFSLGVAFGLPGAYHLVAALPGFKMAFNYRMVMFVALAGAMLAGCGIETIGGAMGRRGLLLAGVGAMVLGAVPWPVAACYWDQARTALAGTGSGLDYLAGRLAVRSGMMLVCGALLIYGFAGGRRRLVCWGLALVAVADLLWFGWGYNPSLPRNLLYPRSPGIELARQEVGDGYITAVDLVMPPQINLVYGLKDIRGNDAISPLLTELYLAHVEPEILAPTVLPALRLLKLSRYDHLLLDRMGVKVVLSYPGRPQGRLDRFAPHLELIYQGEIEVYRNRRASPRARWVPGARQVYDSEAMQLLSDEEFNASAQVLIGPGQVGWEQTRGGAGRSAGGAKGTAEVIDESPNSVTVLTDAADDGYLLLNDLHFPGWQAEVDESEVPLYRANFMMRAVKVPAGKHRVTFVYHPPEFRCGAFISLCGLGCLAGTVVFRRKRDTA